MQLTSNTRAFIEAEQYSDFILMNLNDGLLPDTLYRNVTDFPAGTNLNIKLGLVNHTKKFDGSGDVNPGYPLFDLISLTPTEKYDPRQRLASFMECFLGVKNVPFNPISQYIGLKGMVRVKVEKDDQYGDKNRIAGYVKKS